MSQAVTLEASATGRANVAASQARPVSNGQPDEDFAAHLRQADSDNEHAPGVDRTDRDARAERADRTDRSERADRTERDARAQRKSSAARPLHGKGAPRTSDAQPGQGSGPTASTTDSASSPASDAKTGTEPGLAATSGAAGGPMPATDITVTPLATPAPTATATGSASGPTPAPTSADAVQTSTPLVAAQGAVASAVGAGTGPARPLGLSGHSSVTGNLAGGRLDGRRGPTRAGDAGPVATTGAPAIENFPLDHAGSAGGSAGDGAAAGSGNDLAAALAAAVGSGSDPSQGDASSGSAAQNPGVPTVSAISNVAPTAPVAGSLAAASAGPAVPQESVAGQLAASLQTLRDREDGVHVLTVRLHPDELGPVRVIARLTGNEVQLRVTTSSVAAAAAVTEAGPRLHDALAGAGLSSTGVSVDHDASLAQQFGQGAGASADPRAGSQGGTSHRGTPADVGSAAAHRDRGVDPAAGPAGPARHPEARSLDLHL